MDELTAPQRQVLELIAKGADRGMAPTYRELCTSLDLALKAIDDRIKGLLRKGCVEKVPHRARGLLITPRGWRELGRPT